MKLNCLLSVGLLDLLLSGASLNPEDIVGVEALDRIRVYDFDQEDSDHVKEEKAKDNLSTSQHYKTILVASYLKE